MNYTKLKRIIKEMQDDAEYKEQCEQWKQYKQELNILDLEQ